VHLTGVEDQITVNNNKTYWVKNQGLSTKEEIQETDSLKKGC
jgi:hypothetical protein